MVHRVGRPDACAVTLRAIMREDLTDMIRVRHLLEVRLMTLIAVRVLQLVVAVDVAGLACQRYVRTCQWEIRCRVVEGRRLPCRRRMALCTRMAEVSRNMVRVCRAVEVRGVAIVACCREVLVLVVHMAAVACHRLMCPREREWRI